MNLGLGLYRHALTRENFQFARQAGATHIVARLVDYFKGRAFRFRGRSAPSVPSGARLDSVAHPIMGKYNPYQTKN